MNYASIYEGVKCHSPKTIRESKKKKAVIKQINCKAHCEPENYFFLLHSPHEPIYLLETAGLFINTSNRFYSFYHLSRIVFLKEISVFLKGIRIKVAIF